jgi:hypothetical protein
MEAGGAQGELRPAADTAASDHEQVGLLVLDGGE